MQLEAAITHVVGMQEKKEAQQECESNYDEE